MESNSPTAFASLLRAVADERRLRLLALCADGPATVSALATAVGDSEPNVSRQLKQLAAAGCVRRVRQGQYVEYSAVTEGGPAAETVRWLLSRLDRDDGASRAARAALRRARAADPPRASPVARLALAPSRLGRALCAALLEGDDTPSPARVLLGCRQPELLAALARGASRIGLLATSAAERAALVRWSVGAGLDAEAGLSATFLAEPAGRRWDLVVLDVGLESGEAQGLDAVRAVPAGGVAGALAAQVALARSLLAPGGSAWLICDYEALESPAGGERVAPPQRLRAALRDAALECRDVVPVEADGRHLLVARSQPLRAAVAPFPRSA